MKTYKIVIYFNIPGYESIKEIWADFKSKQDALKWTQSIYVDKAIPYEEIRVIDPLI